MTEEDTQSELVEQIASKIMTEQSFATVIETDELLYLEEGVYRRGGDIKAKARAEELIPDCGNHFAAEVVGKLKRRTYCHLAEFDKDPMVLNFRNGFLDLKRLWSADPEEVASSFFDRERRGKADGRLFRVQIPARYDQEKRAPANLRFFREVLPDPFERALFLEYASTCLYRSAEFQKALMLIGEGDNGKSTAIGVLTCLLGEDNVSNQSIHHIAHNRFSPAQLEGKLANFFPDISSNEISQTGILKGLIAGDHLDVERKGIDFFRIWPTLKMIFSCNTLPQVEDDSDAWFRRWIIIYFRQKFDGREDRGLIPKSRTGGPGKLTTEEEMSGLLNVLLRVLRVLLVRGTFTRCQTTAELRSEWGERANVIISFKNQSVVADAKAHIPKEAVYEAYLAFCADKKFSAKGRAAFNEALRIECAPIREDVMKIAGKSVKVWRGIRWKDPARSQPASQEPSLGQFGQDPAPVADPVEPVEGVETVEDPLPAPAAPPDPPSPAQKNEPREPVPTTRSFDKAVSKARENCSDCGLLLGRGTGNTIFWHEGKVFCSAHFPKKASRGSGV